jgi:hypothetical protein
MLLGTRQNGAIQRLMKQFLIFAVATGLIALSTGTSKAALGWTLDESVRHFGAPSRGPLPDQDGIGRAFYLFKVKNGSIGAFYLNGKISRVVYNQKEVLEESAFGAFLLGNAPEVVWIPLRDSKREWLGCTGTLQVKCWAQLNASRTTLVIATEEDYNAVRAAGGS